jgi:membrane protein implicated in regulation of membrane protease activity
MQDKTWIIWLVLLVASLVLESLSMQLFSVWFALGAAAALLSCAFAAPVWLQVVLFVAVTAVSLAATRPLVKKLQKKVMPSNADRCLGKAAEVLEEIDNLKGAGQIRVEGQIWSARAAEDGAVIPAGLAVETVAIQGNKILVRPLPETE